MGGRLPVGNKRSLTYLISKYVAFILLFILMLIISSIFFLNYLVNANLVYPANYAEIKSTRIEDDFKKGKLKLEEIPFYYDYQYRVNQEIVENTIDKKFDTKISEALRNGNSSTSEIMGSSIFKAFKYMDEELVLKYKISMILASEKAYKYINDFELYYITNILIIFLGGLVFLVRRLSRLLIQEIDKISEANQNIENMNLDYARKDSDYKEVSGVLTSIDKLAKDLKASLKKQWSMMLGQKEMVEAITHDIRTPITLIKGNLDLLKEAPENFCERIEDINRGLERLETYVEKLKNFSYLMEGEKVEITEKVLGDWIQLISSITKIHGNELEILDKETSSIKLDKEAISVALQNLINNAIENSAKRSLISISFISSKDKFSIIVRDQGSGFDEKILKNFKKKLVSSKSKDYNSIHGIGLSIVNRMVEANNGTLSLDNHVEGAEVKMEFIL